MLYKEPFVLYLNISVCIILLFLALPTLLSRREELKVRLAFFLIFFVVIFICLINLVVFHWGNYKMVAYGIMGFFFPLLFGPLIYYYVKKLLGSQVKKGFWISLFPGMISLGYGIYLALAEDVIQQKVYMKILSGNHLLNEINNLLTLVLTLIYCVKAFLFIKTCQYESNDNPSLAFKIKLDWAKEFILYMFANVFVFLILMLVMTNGFSISQLNIDLIAMPIFMLLVYLLVAIRSMMMYKEFEYQFIISGVAHQNQIQHQRLEISRELHDSMGAHLTFMSSILDGLKDSSSKLENFDSKIQRLSGFCEDSISELKNTLWVLNTKEINLNDLKAKILNFIKNASEVKEELVFSLNFEVSENLNLNSKQAVNIFRTIQEIVNNAIKYAQASEIKINVEQNAKNLKINITDNGQGFDYESEKNKSFGLMNIHSRIMEIRGNINLKTSAGRGTDYTIQIEL